MADRNKRGGVRAVSIGYEMEVLAGTEVVVGVIDAMDYL